MGCSPFTIILEMARTLPSSKPLLMVIMLISMHRERGENVGRGWVTQLSFKLEPSLRVLTLKVKGRLASRPP